MKISIIGAGLVGSTIAYTLMIKNLGREIFLIDINKNKEEGEVLDISDVISYTETEKIKRGNYDDVKDSDIIIISAGASQNENQNRLDLIDINKNIIKNIFKEIGEIKKSSIVIMVSNPVDILTNLAQELSNLPQNQVFGTGTCLDTARLRTILSEKFKVDSSQINGFVLGEHGDSGFIPWSNINIEGNFIEKSLNDEEKNEIENKIKNKAYDIISKKGATFYGISIVVVDIVEAILFDQNKILSVSTQFDKMKEMCGNICLGNPNIIGRKGIMGSWQIELNDIEKEKLSLSVNILKKYL